MIFGIDFYRDLQGVDQHSVNTLACRPQECSPLERECKNTRNADPCQNLGVYCLGVGGAPRV